jgi:multiple sugar transport system permease protein
MMQSSRAEARRTALLLIAPATIVLLAMNVFPFLFAVYVSLHNWVLGRPRGPTWAGTFNYEDLLQDDRFINALLVSAEFVAIAVTVEFLLGLGLAFVFNSRLRGLATLRKIALLPVMVMPLATGLVWFYIFNENFGVANWFLTLLGSERIGFLTDNTLALLSIVLADVWQWTPFVMLVMFAALQSVPEYVYEAAKMDGLSGWQTFWRVTLPLLKPAIAVVLILRAVDAFRMIELVYLMTKGGPGGTTEVLPWYIYVTGFQSVDLGYASAQAVVMLVIVTIVAQLFVRRLQYREAPAS